MEKSGPNAVTPPPAPLQIHVFPIENLSPKKRSFVNDVELIVYKFFLGDDKIAGCFGRYITTPLKIAKLKNESVPSKK